MASSYMYTAGSPRLLFCVVVWCMRIKLHRNRTSHGDVVEYATKNQTVFYNSVLRSQKTTALGHLRRNNHEGRLTHKTIGETSHQQPTK